MYINRFFAMAVLKSRDKDFLNAISFSPKQVEGFIKDKGISFLPVSIFGKVDEESTEVYDKFISKIMVEESSKLIANTTPYLGDSHKLIQQLKKLNKSNSYTDLKEILVKPDLYLDNISDVKEVALHFSNFYNAILNSIDVKYLKALAASVINSL